MNRTVCAVVLMAAFVGPMDAQKRRKASRARITEPAVVDAGAVNDAKLQDRIGPKADGPAVVRAQILLDRAHFSPGEIDGQYGENLEKAVAGFQAASNLPANGVVGPETWAILNQDTAPALIPYTITKEDLAGPFVQVPSDLMEQAKLQALGYQSAQEQLGERFHVNPKLLAALNAGRRLDREGEQIVVPNVITAAPAKADRVEVSKSCSCVTALGADGKVVAWYAATIGSEHDPLPVGTWKITGVQRNPVFHYNAELFWDAKNPNEKAKIAAGPNNPVGVVWIDLNKEHYGIHGTPDPSKVGHVTSHGCIRLTNWDAAELASMVKPGTPAILKD